MMKFSAGEFDSIDVTKPGGTVETVRPRDGVFNTNDASEIEALRGFGLVERTDAQVKAAKASRKTSTKTREEAGLTAKVVDVAETGETDTRGPGAPAEEV
jgi:hypothetical protein